MSSFRRSLEAWGARITERDGAPFVESFGDPEAEYRAARQGALVVPHLARGIVRVTGRDRVGFLQNMLTNDVKALGPGEGCRAALLSPKGKVLADLLVYALDEAILVETEPARVGRFVEALERYIVSEDVRLEPVGERFAAMSVLGPDAADALVRAGGAELVRSLAPFRFVLAELGGRPARIAAVRRAPGPAFDVVVDAEGAEAALGALRAAGGALGGEAAAEIRRIEAGLPRFGREVTEEHFPLEARLDEAIHFGKGCYVGQEFVARLAHRGHVNRILSGLRIEAPSPPAPGAAVRDEERTVGAVTSACVSPALGGPIALAYLRRERAEPGTRLRVEAPDGEAPALVAALPFLETP